MVTGTADKIKQAEEKVQGATPAPETRPAGTDERTKAEKTYTQTEVDALLGKSGGRMKAQLELVTREREEYRQKHESATKTHSELNGQITEAREEIKTLRNSLEELNSEDAGKVRRLIKDWQDKLSGLKERENQLVPREERVNTFERTELIYAVADDYGLDEAEAKDKFKAAADRLKLNDRDGLTALAESMNLQLREEEAEPPKKPKAPKPYSGKSEGGTPYFSRKQFDPTTKEGRKFWLQHKDEIQKAEKDGLIQD